ncbi:MAG: hypothetical protein M0010_22630 [Actinomycetota bacterium]|nr:hypothetical protein [Actinomycetota bacterium]
MPMVVTTKDCTALGDAELEELADLGMETSGFDIGFLSKEREEWVLVTTVRDGRKLRGYSFCTLERIGGTPSLLVGVASVDRTGRAESALKAMMADQFRRALLAFPDEDVLLGTRLLGPDGFRAFLGLSDVVPAAGHRASGEERAWARRLAKRFGVEARLDDRTFILKGNGGAAGGLDFVHPKVKLPDGVHELFSEIDPARGDRLVAFGWAMAEDLAGGKFSR